MFLHSSSVLATEHYTWQHSLVSLTSNLTVYYVSDAKGIDGLQSESYSNLVVCWFTLRYYFLRVVVYNLRVT